MTSFINYNMMDNKINYSKKWDKEEDFKLIKYIEENKSYREISIELNKSIGSISSRVLDKIIFPEYNGKNINELLKKYKYKNVENLQKCLENKKKISNENVKHVQKNIKNSGSSKSDNLSLKLIERLEKVEYKIDLYCPVKK